MDRPALTRLLHAVEAGELDCVVVYKVDRLSRSLLDFTRMLSVFEKHQVSFVAVTQQFNTSTSLGRLTLNILLSFAQPLCQAVEAAWRNGIVVVVAAGNLGRNGYATVLAPGN